MAREGRPRHPSSRLNAADDCTAESVFNAGKGGDALAIEVFHRMGDVGYVDDRGRLWFCGRKSHRVVTQNGTLFTDMVEPIFNTVEGVARTALVGAKRKGETLPVLCIEQRVDFSFYGVRVTFGGQPWEKLVAQLREVGARHEHTRGITTFLEYVGTFPVDVRHNSKIFREKLAVWADTQLDVNGAPTQTRKRK